MGVYTFECRSADDGVWSAKQYSGDLVASAALTYDLQRKLVKEAQSRDSFGDVQSSYSLITPSSAVVIGGTLTASGGGGVLTSGSVGTAVAEEPTAEDKKEDEEETDDEMGSIFDDIECKVLEF
ncbi:hypothetical protein MKW94_017143 [Papaver nudicaule]|uniref:Uncharacterized protein n=1 Tax=Papaver nudicaule TaxID=74823 RepID=A0AA41VAI0_PAPNU|nr:hypothetical protein [Papaver nudicaule]